MKILYIAHKPPFPIVDGGCYAMWQCLKGLSKVAEVDSLIIETQKHPFTEESQKELNAICSSVVVHRINTRFKPLNALRIGLKKESYNLKRFADNELARTIQRQLENKYDVIVCDSLYAAASFHFYSFKSSAKLILRAHNIESELWKQHAQEETNALKKHYFSSLSQTLRNTEIKLMNQFDSVWALTSEDQAWIETNTSQKDAKLFPVSVYINPDLKVDYSINGFFHLGSMNWKPNQEAVSYLFNQLWSDPALASIPLKIAGSNSETLSPPANTAIEIVGFVPDLAHFMCRAGILISPIQSGSGIRIKLLEAMAFGIPCITTTLGAIGIEVDKAGLSIANQVQEFKKIALELHQNEALRKELGQKAQAYVLKNHSFEASIVFLKNELGG